MTSNPTINRSQILDAIAALQLPNSDDLLEVRIFKAETVNVFRSEGPVETYDVVDGPRPAKPLQHNHLPACCCQGEFTDCPACPEHGDHECPSCHAINGHAHTEYCQLENREYPGQPGERPDKPRTLADQLGHVSEASPTTIGDRCGRTLATNERGWWHWCILHGAHDEHLCGCGTPWPLLPATEPAGLGDVEHLRAEQDQADADIAAEPWVDNGCRCPNPDQHQPGCPALDPPLSSLPD